jgi:type IV fimbrial biogenesis protein FimT
MGIRAPSGGYSLYELIMTMGLFALILTLGVPSFGAIVANHRVRVEIDGLFHAIHHARKESITRRRAVTICPTANGLECGPRAAWSSGWMMFVNVDRDWPAVRDPDEPVVKWIKVHPQNRVVANRASFSLRSTRLRATNGTIVVCDRAGRARPRALVISVVGRPRVAYETPRGRPYSCAD